MKPTQPKLIKSNVKSINRLTKINVTQVSVWHIPKDKQRNNQKTQVRVTRRASQFQDLLKNMRKYD